MTADATLFPGFEARRIPTPGTTIHCVGGGKGPPLLLLHGYPQTHAMWHKVAPALARDYTVVIPMDTTSAGSGYETTIGFYNVLNSGNANLANEPLKPRAVTLTRTDLITFQ